MKNSGLKCLKHGIISTLFAKLSIEEFAELTEGLKPILSKKLQRDVLLSQQDYGHLLHLAKLILIEHVEMMRAQALLKALWEATECVCVVPLV